MKNGGWFFGLTDATPIPHLPAPRPQPSIDAAAMWCSWSATTTTADVVKLATSLGVDPIALKLLGCVWTDRQAWGFPMRNGSAEIVGIRLRAADGQQWAVKGSKAGLFIPELPACQELWICEGASDTAALLTLGFYAIGRPSCLGTETEVLQICRRNKVRRVIIMADCDDPGQRGAERLRNKLRVPSVILYPPGAKDARQYLNRNGSADRLKNALRDLIWHQP